MSKYYKAEDIMEIFSDESRPENWMGTETEIQEQVDFDFYKSQIESLPTIEVSEDCISREWIDNGNWMGFECSRCKCHSRYITPFCPHCGAKMKGADNE